MELKELEQFSVNNIDCILTLRFQPVDKRTYYVLDILYIGLDKHWASIKAGSFDLKIATKELFEYWENRETPIKGIL